MISIFSHVMSSSSTPRDFILLVELEEGNKYGISPVSWGLTDPNDSEMVNWTASITGPPGLLSQDLPARHRVRTAVSGRSAASEVRDQHVVRGRRKWSGDRIWPDGPGPTTRSP